MKNVCSLKTMPLFNRRTVNRFAPILMLLSLVACDDSDNSTSAETLPIPEDITNPPDFTQAEFRNCLTFEPNASDPESVEQFECASVSIPLDWDNTDGQSINYFVRRLKSVSPTRGQLWVLPGGPGIAGDDWEQGLILAQQLPDLDIYMPDHRGTGRSSFLGCSEQEDQNPYFIDDVSDDACLNYLEATRGQTLNNYNVTQAAKDVGMLAGQWQSNNEEIYLYGSSYGTYWAHRYLQLFPEQASGILLDAVCDLDGCDEQNGFFSTYNETGQTLLSLCDSDLECSNRLGGNAATFMGDLYNKLDDGHCSDLDIGREDLQFIAGFALGGGRETQALLPAFLFRLDRCTEDDMVAIERLLEVADEDDEDDEPSETSLPESRGLTLNIRFSELWDNAISIQDIEDQSDSSFFAGDGFSDEELEQFELQSIWPVYTLDEFHFNWAISSTPLLITNGTLDPITPVTNAENMKAQFNAPNQQLISIPLAGHETLSNSPEDSGDCSFLIAVQFFQDPLGDLDDGCLQSIPALNFSGDSASAQLFWGTDSYWD